MKEQHQHQNTSWLMAILDQLLAPDQDLYPFWLAQQFFTTTPDTTDTIAAST